MGKTRLIAPHCTVIMDDGAVFEVQSNNWDMLCAERWARKVNLSIDTASLEISTFVAWNALRREAMIPPDVTFAVFAGTETVPGRAVSIQSRAGKPQDPTPRVPEDA